MDLYIAPVGAENAELSSTDSFLNSSTGGFVFTPKLMRLLLTPIGDAELAVIVDVFETALERTTSISAGQV